MTTDVETENQDTELDELAVVEEQQEPEQQAEELPEKYQGKSLEELVRMNEETQKFIGQQANEIGELRKAVDAVVQANLPAPEDPPDFFEDPERAIAAHLNNHPAIKSAQQASEVVARETAKNALLAAHGDAMSVIQSPEFTKWRDSSSFRKNLWNQAQAYDAEAGIELLTLFKERQGVVEQTENLEKGQRKQDAKRASTGSTRGTGNAPAKTFRRADIVQLMRTDPERYQKLAPEIRAAYAQGRVK